MKQQTQDKNIKVEYALRQYQSGDELPILELFEEVFRKKRSLAHWRWKFLQNPYASPVLGLARSPNGSMVAHYGTIPVPLNLGGQQVLAAQSVDTIVREEYRKDGLFTKTAEQCYAQCTSKQIEAVYGFPNKAAYPGRIKRLQWREIGYLDHFVIKLSRYQSFRRILKNEFLGRACDLVRTKILSAIFQTKAKWLKARLGEGELVISERLPSGYSRFWEKIKGQETLSLWKDAQYMRWRYDENAEHCFRYFGFQRGEELLALVVVQTQGETAHLCECFSLGKDPMPARWLVLQVLLDVLKTHQTIYFRGFDNGFFREVFQDFPYQKAEADVLCGRVLSENRSLQDLFYSPAAWSISLGDSDEI